MSVTVGTAWALRFSFASSSFYVHAEMSEGLGMSEVQTEATRNKCHASSNKCLTSSNKKLLGTSALLLGTRSY